MKMIILNSVMLLMVALSAQAQNITVHGTVVSSTDNEPLIGASVQSTADGTLGVITDIDGNFQISVPNGSSLIISYIGFKEKTLKAEAQMNIVLDEDNNLIEEVVVTGYSTQKKADLTGSVAVVSTNTLKTASDADPMKSL